ncbi:hypothetical protein OF001_U290031 [Pseudomonas sp. OF001]|nr:hypothetical protein OF001_U290031 [Pseudomonas sp. OF001]
MRATGVLFKSQVFDFKGFSKTGTPPALLLAQQKQERGTNRIKTRRNGSNTTRTTGWRRNKLILLERSCPTGFSPDRPENDKTAPRQRPAPVRPARVAATSASKGIRLFLSPVLGLQPDHDVRTGDRQEQQARKHKKNKARPT